MLYSWRILILDYFLDLIKKGEFGIENLNYLGYYLIKNKLKDY